MEDTALGEDWHEGKVTELGYYPLSDDINETVYFVNDEGIINALKT